MSSRIKGDLKRQRVNAKNAEKHGTDGLSHLSARIVAVS